MCRNIRPLHNFEPEATSQEVHDAALQYVRPPKDREVEREKARARAAKRFSTTRAS